jgi:hypothetical protein
VQLLTNSSSDILAATLQGSTRRPSIQETPLLAHCPLSIAILRKLVERLEMEANNKENETGLPMAKDSRPDGGITTEDRSVKPSSVAESKEEETIAEGLEEEATVETVDGSNVEATTAVTPPEATGNDSSAPPQAHKGEEDVTQEDPSTPTKIPQETMESQKKEERKEAQLDLAALQRPLKRARTAYFIFAEDRRPELQKQVSKDGTLATR